MKNPMSVIFQRLGSSLARYLSKPSAQYDRFSLINQVQLVTHLKPGDLLLVEGNSRISTAIKYLTQSTWSHVAICVGDGTLVEADLVNGVVRVPIGKYVGYNLRICRPCNLTDEDTDSVVNYVLGQLGHQYDVRNVIDLMRYLVPTPPMPPSYRRNLISLGSGEPTKAICSTMIAQAFMSVKYPILPREVKQCDGDLLTDCDATMLESRHYSHFTPRDFDLSPFFAVIKPTLANDFDYKKILWLEERAGVA
jgi:hypothetical protein